MMSLTHRNTTSRRKTKTLLCLLPHPTRAPALAGLTYLLAQRDSAIRTAGLGTTVDAKAAEAATVADAEEEGAAVVVAEEAQVAAMGTTTILIEDNAEDAELMSII